MRDAVINLSRDPVGVGVGMMANSRFCAKCLKLNPALSLCLLLPEGGAKPPIRSPNLPELFFIAAQAQHTGIFPCTTERTGKWLRGFCLAKAHFALWI